MAEGSASSSFLEGAAPASSDVMRPTSNLAINMALGSAAMQMETTSTIPTSSASPSCASCADASSSLAMAHATANTRSPPKDDNASVVAPGIEAIHLFAYHVAKDDAEAASTEGFSLTVEGQIAPLHVHRFVITRGVSSTDGLAGISKRKYTKKMPKPNAKVKEKRYAKCIGSVFGSTLRSVLQFSGVCLRNKKKTVAALREIIRYLQPVGGSHFLNLGEVDVDNLISGLGTCKVSRTQQQALDECNQPSERNTWLQRAGISNVTIGVTAAVLVAHFVMMSNGLNAADVAACLNKCVDNASFLLRNWKRDRINQPEIHCAALQTERDALQRAADAAKAAAVMAKNSNLDQFQALNLQLTLMRTAAYSLKPRNKDGEDEGEIPVQTNPMFVIMPHIRRAVESSRADDDDDGNTFGSDASSSIASSIASSVSSLSSWSTGPTDDGCGDLADQLSLL